MRSRAPWPEYLQAAVRRHVLVHRVPQFLVERRAGEIRNSRRLIPDIICFGSIISLYHACFSPHFATRPATAVLRSIMNRSSTATFGIGMDCFLFFAYRKTGLIVAYPAPPHSMCMPRTIVNKNNIIGDHDSPHRQRKLETMTLFCFEHSGENHDHRRG